jgi:hypothetical protein
MDLSTAQTKPVNANRKRQLVGTSKTSLHTTTSTNQDNKPGSWAIKGTESHEVKKTTSRIQHTTIYRAKPQGRIIEPVTGTNQRNSLAYTN